MTYVKCVSCCLLLLLLVGTACNNNSVEVQQEQEQLQRKVDSLVAENERLQAELSARLEVVPPASPDETSPPTSPASDPTANVDHLIRPGEHAITLQWISWDHPGKVDIQYAGDGQYTVSGGQKSRENDDYLRMEGTIKPRSAREFVFDGTVEYQVSHNNNGKPCRKTGPLVFKASGKRSYWRMQEMTNCEGGLLTDYVDVYF